MHDLGMLEAGDQRQDRLLHVAGEARRNAVAIIFEGVSTFRLQKDLMSFTVGEPDNLVFDRGTVAWSGALDLTRIHRWRDGGCADQLMDGPIRVGDMAVELGLGDGIGHERERDGVGIPGLGL